MIKKILNALFCVYHFITSIVLVKKYTIIYIEISTSA